MPVSHSQPIWPEEHRFSPPPSPLSTDSSGNNPPDDVLAVLAEKSPLKNPLKRISTTIKRYTLPPRAAYPYWKTHTPAHIIPAAIESEAEEQERGKPAYPHIRSPLTRGDWDTASLSAITVSDRSVGGLKLRKFGLEEWRLVGERVWVNGEGVRVREREEGGIVVGGGEEAGEGVCLRVVCKE